MFHIRLNESVLLFDSRVSIRFAAVWLIRIVIVVSPFGEMVSKFSARDVGSCIFEIDDHQLLVDIGRLDQWRFLIVQLDS